MGTVLPNFPASPISEVQPFTYRDNESYLSQLHRLRDYVRENLQRLNNQEIVDVAALRDNINTLSDALNADITTFEATVNDEIAGYVAQLNAAIATANEAKTEADAAVASQDSATAQNINTGPLTDAALNTFLNSSSQLTRFDQTTATNIGNDASQTAVAGDTRWIRSAALGVSQVVNPTHAALQAALSNMDGLRVTTAGTYTTNQTLTITRECDLSMLTIHYTGSGTDTVLVGDANAQTFRKNVKLPQVINDSKTALGWAQSGVAGTTGVRLVNLYSCTVTVPYVNNFARGLVISGAAANGSQQNTIHLGHLDNNQINQDFNSPDNAGWCNQNTFIGGRMSHNSNEGSKVAGTRHVRFSALANSVNGNNFIGTSLESPDVVEYHIETANAIYNTMVGVRFENTVSADRRILSTGTSKNNVLMGGAYAETLIQVCTGGGQPWAVRTSGVNQMFQSGTGPTMWAENSTSNTASAICVTPAGTATSGADPVASSGLNITANGLYGKRGTDAVGNERVILDFQNGLTKYGPGGVAPAVTVGQLGGYLSLGGVTVQTAAPAAGAGAALPATPAGYMVVFVNGTNQKIPYY